MKLKDYLGLMEYLVGEQGYPVKIALRTIWRLRSMDKEILEAFEHWMLTKKDPEIIVNDTTYLQLKEMGMKPVRAFLMLDWIKCDPVGAYTYLSELPFIGVIEPLDEEQKKELDAALRQLKERGVDTDKIIQELDEATYPQDDSSEDVDLDTEVDHPEAYPKDDTDNNLPTLN